MSYILRKSNGKILVTLADQKLDTVSTSLTLIGKNVSNYGTALNDNFVSLLENFASSVEPKNPLTGQIWYNTLEQRLFVYTGVNEFKPIGSPYVSANIPAGLSSGDLWIDTTARQLKFFDGINLVPAGLPYDHSKGKSGWLLESIVDSAGSTNPVVCLYLNNNLLGILSDQAFTLKAPYPDVGGMTSVVVGFNVNTSSSSLAQIKWIGTATSAESIGNISISNLYDKSREQTVQGSLTVEADAGVIVGEAQDVSFYVSTGTGKRIASISVGGANQDMAVTLNSPNSATAIYLDSTNEYMGVFRDTPESALDVGGDLIVRGAFRVIGSSTAVTVTELSINNKNVVLNSSSGTVTDSMALGGGVILKGDSDKTILWNSSPIPSWKSSENFNLDAGKSYYIGGVPVLTANALSSDIVSAPGLVQIGNLTSLNVGRLTFSQSSIGVVNSSPLVLAAGSASYIDCSGKKITNAATPQYSDSNNVVATKGYVDAVNAVSKSGQFTLTVDITGHGTVPDDPAVDPFVINLLQSLLPPDDTAPYGVADGGRVRVLIQKHVNQPQTSVLSNSLSVGDPVTVDKAGVRESASVIQYSSSLKASTNIPGATIKVCTAIKQYIVSGGVWIALPYNNTASNTVYNDGTW